MNETPLWVIVLVTTIAFLLLGVPMLAVLGGWAREQDRARAELDAELAEYEAEE